MWKSMCDYTADLLAGKRPELQLLVDATAMSQAGVGSVYIGQIVNWVYSLPNFYPVVSYFPTGPWRGQSARGGFLPSGF